jgi:hypothetical protein
MLPYNKIRILVSLIGKDNKWYYYALEKIDLEKKEVFLKLHEENEITVRCFDYNIFSILRGSKKGDYKVFIPKESTTFNVFSEIERNETHMIGYLSFGYLHQNRWFRTAPSMRQDIITPDFYRYKDGKGNIYLSEVLQPKEGLGIFNSVIIRPENYREDIDVSNYLALAYSVVGIKKHKGETKNKPSGYNCHELKISVWITREGNEFILGNTEDDLVGVLGFRLPSYHYRELEDGESRWVDIYCLKM